MLELVLVLLFISTADLSISSRYPGHWLWTNLGTTGENHDELALLSQIAGPPLDEHSRWNGVQKQKWWNHGKTQSGSTEKPLPTFRVIF
jgi:hypothetical protein